MSKFNSNQSEWVVFIPIKQLVVGKINRITEVINSGKTCGITVRSNGKRKRHLNLVFTHYTGNFFYGTTEYRGEEVEFRYDSIDKTLLRKVKGKKSS